jgi:hypothetical protein
MPRRLLLCILCIILSTCCARTDSSAQRRTSNSSSTISSSSNKVTSSGPVHVRTYTRKDGTVVQCYDRSAPGTKPLKTTTTAKGSTSTAVPRDWNGKIKRSASAKAEFERETGIPSWEGGIRSRPYRATGVWRWLCADKHAMANGRRSQGQRLRPSELDAIDLESAGSVSDIKS